MSDGGEGLLDVLGGPNRTSVVTGPLGDPVTAAWRLDRRTAVIEMATASGLALVGGADGNDPLGASTVGTGQLIDRALERGRPLDHRRARRVGDDRRRARRHRRAAQPGPRALDRRARGLRRAHHASSRRPRCSRRRRAPRRPRSRSSRPASSSWSGGTRRSTASTSATSRAAGPPAGWPAGWPRSGPGWSAGSTSSPSTSSSTSGWPPPTSSSPARATSTSRASRARSSAASATSPPAAAGPVVVIVGDADPAVAEALGARPGPGVSVLSLIERYGEQRAFDEPRWCIEHAAAEALRR